MRRVAGVLAVLVVVVTAEASWAQDPKQRVQQFFEKVKAGQIANGIDDLLKGSPAESNPQAVDALKRQAVSALPLYGSVLRWESLYEETLTPSVTRLVYFLVHEKAPTVWQFYFFKPRDQWVLATINFGDQFQNLGRVK